MTTRQTRTFPLNGVVDTAKTVKANLETIASACGSFITFDIHNGLWSAIINQPGTAKWSFDDSNITSSIGISGTGLTSIYNEVKVTFPSKYLNDASDFVTLYVPDADRNPNEPDNVLNIQYDVINDPIQAQMLGLIELKQGRVDKIIQFNTDFSMLGINAGDLIDVTNEMYGFDHKMFRIMTIYEDDSGDGNITLSITALEYDPKVYDFSDLNFYLRETGNGIVSTNSNGNVSISNGAATATSAFRSLVNDYGFHPEVFGSHLASSASMYVHEWSDATSTDDNFSAYTYTNDDYYFLGMTYTVTDSGNYRMDYLVKHFANAEDDGNNLTLATPIRKNAKIFYRINNTGAFLDVGPQGRVAEVRGSPTGQFSLTGTCHLDKDSVVYFYLATKTDWSPSHPGSNSSSLASSAFIADVKLVLLHLD